MKHVTFHSYVMGIQGSELEDALDSVSTKAETMADELQRVPSRARVVQEGFDQQSHYVDILKHSYQAFKEA